MRDQLDILAFSPHPDDAELGCGGSLLLAADRGQSTAVADVTNGECATRGSVEKRNNEKAKASELLGLCNRFSLGLPDTKVGHDPDHRLPLIELIRSTRPRVVLAPYWHDRHPDHEAVGRLVREACFYAGVAMVGSQKPFRPERVYYYMIHTPFTPSFVVDITPVWDRKMTVLHAYGSQFFDNRSDQQGKTSLSSGEFIDFYKSRSIYFGAMIGTSYGEPFFSITPVPASRIPGISDLRSSPDLLPPYCPM